MRAVKTTSSLGRLSAAGRLRRLNVAALLATTMMVVQLVILGEALAHENPSRVIESAVIIHYHRDGKLVPTCSGANVALPQGNRIVTAGHCLLRRTAYYAKDVRGNTYTLRLEAADRTAHDYALFTSSAAYLLPALELAHLPAGIDDLVFMAAAPAALNLQLYRGYVTGYAHPLSELADNWQGALIVDIGAAQGSSGGVVTNERGEALGILSGTFEVPDGFPPRHARLTFPGYFVVPMPLAPAAPTAEDLR